MLHSHPVLGVGCKIGNAIITRCAQLLHSGCCGNRDPWLTLLLGFFYFPMEDSLFAILPGHRFESPPLAAAQLQAALVVWFVTALFLTRNQMLVPYILAGLVIVTNHIQFRPEIQGHSKQRYPVTANLKLETDSSSKSSQNSKAYREYWCHGTICAMSLCL